jgi:hypothetical protein
MFRRSGKAAATLVLMLVVLQACGSWNLFMRSSQDEFVAAAKKYQSDALQYRASGDVIAAAHAKVTPAQWARFAATQEAVRAADTRVVTLFAAWSVNGGKRSDKPPQMDAALAALSNAQNQVVVLSMEVNTVVTKLF